MPTSDAFFSWSQLLQDRLFLRNSAIALIVCVAAVALIAFFIGGQRIRVEPLGKVTFVAAQGATLSVNALEKLISEKGWPSDKQKIFVSGYLTDLQSACDANLITPDSRLVTVVTTPTSATAANLVVRPKTCALAQRLETRNTNTTIYVASDSPISQSRSEKRVFQLDVGSTR